MKLLDIPRSGRDGDYVYYMRAKTLCRRKYLVPKDVRSTARTRARGAFAAIVKAWSRVLSEEQRRAWNAAAAKVQSHPRLYQSGPLIGQTLFAGINNSRSRIGRAWLLWPSERAVFPPNPVEGLSLCMEQGRLRLKLRVAGPVDGDIMVFGAAPCSAGRRKWRHGAFLGLLPAPVGGESDITELYVARYGQPEPGKRVFIRTRQQKEGWEDHPWDVSEVAGVAELHGLHPLHGLHGAAGAEIRGPKAEIRRKPECRGPKAGWAVGWGRTRCTTEQYRSCTGHTPSQYRLSTGCSRRAGQFWALWRPRGLADARRTGHWRELWRGT